MIRPRIGARDNPTSYVAMTGTHDTPTVAGWWSGLDLDWADRSGRLPAVVDRAKAENIRDWDRGLLWSTSGDGEQRPAPDDSAPMVEAALAQVAKSLAVLLVVPLEDLLGEAKQPNLPGTIAEHPNWRRRLSASLSELLDEPATRGRLKAIAGCD